MLELQCQKRKKWRKRLRKGHKASCHMTVRSIEAFPFFDVQLIRYKYFSAGLLSSVDKYPSHTKRLAERGLKLKKVPLHALVDPWCECITTF